MAQFLVRKITTITLAQPEIRNIYSSTTTAYFIFLKENSNNNTIRTY